MRFWFQKNKEGNSENSSDITYTEILSNEFVSRQVEGLINVISENMPEIDIEELRKILIINFKHYYGL